MINKLLLAGAGTGKTTYIVNEALKEQTRILITTFTIRCREEIETKIINEVGYIPQNIIIQTWFSFLLEHGIKPYKKDLNIYKVNGINFVEGKSGLRSISKNGFPIYYGEKNFDKYYFDDYNRIYTDKISKLVLKINEASGNLVFERINKIFDKIFIDEVQDMVGYDLEIIKELANLSSSLIIVGDPRQNIYNTHCDSKYDKYSKGNIDDFIIHECSKQKFIIDKTSLNLCHRCHKNIVIFLNEFYSEYGKLDFMEIPLEDSQGMFVIRTKDLELYLKKYNPIQLRYNKTTKTNNNYQAINYRNSKGCTFDRTIIYPTDALKKYIEKCKIIEKVSTKNTIYVALSRAINSVAIVYDGVVSEKLNINIWNSNL